MTIYNDEILSSYPTQDSFFISFRASLLEDLIFFSFIGIIIYITAFRTTEDDDVQTRIASIMNAELSSTSSKVYFNEKLMEALTYYNDLKITITISETNIDKEYIKIDVLYGGTIVNMSKDLPIDILLKLYATSDKYINDRSGEVRFIQAYDHNGKQLLTQLPKAKILKENKKFYFKESIKIESNKTIDFAYGFWIWNEFQKINDIKAENGFIISSDRFVSNLIIEINNEVGSECEMIIKREKENIEGENKWEDIKHQTYGNNKIKCETNDVRYGEKVSINIFKGNEKDEKKDENVQN